MKFHGMWVNRWEHEIVQIQQLSNHLPFIFSYDFTMYCLSVPKLKSISVHLHTTLPDDPTRCQTLLPHNNNLETIIQKLEKKDKNTNSTGKF